jgi:hypothetical protein
MQSLNIYIYIHNDQWSFWLGDEWEVGCAYFVLQGRWVRGLETWCRCHSIGEGVGDQVGKLENLSSQSCECTRALQNKTPRWSAFSVHEPCRSRHQYNPIVHMNMVGSNAATSTSGLQPSDPPPLQNKICAPNLSFITWSETPLAIVNILETASSYLISPTAIKTLSDVRSVSGLRHSHHPEKKFCMWVGFHTGT